MIHQPEYVKSLLRKHLRGEASISETKLLMMAWDLYEDDELLTFIEEICEDTRVNARKRESLFRTNIS